MKPKIAIIIVSYNHARFLRACFASLDKITYPKDAVKVFLLDNKSGDETVAMAKGELLDVERGVTAGGIPATLIESQTNTGFAGGNNECIRRAMAEGYDFVYLLNPDTEVEPDFLERAVEAAGDPSVGAVQSLLMLGQDKRKINSVGNAFHYLGFSYCVGYQDRLDDPKYARLRETTPEIPCASGASVLLRVATLKEVGLLEELLFAYHEDAELSLRLRLGGWKVVLAPKSVVYHHYDFSRSIQKYYWMERNRWIVLFATLKFPTLLLTDCMQFILELGMLFFSFRSGWWREKFRVYAWFWNPKNIVAMFRMRARVQKIRKIPDRDLVRFFTSEISYQEIDNTILRHIGNPLMRAYWRIVRPLIRW